MSSSGTRSDSDIASDWTDSFGFVYRDLRRVILSTRPVGKLTHNTVLTNPPIILTATNSINTLTLDKLISYMQNYLYG